MITYIDHKINLKNKFILLDLPRCIKTVTTFFSDDLASVLHLFTTYKVSKKTTTIVSSLASPDFICF